MCDISVLCCPQALVRCSGVLDAQDFLHFSVRQGRVGNPVLVWTDSRDGCPKPLFPTWAHLPWPYGCQHCSTAEVCWGSLRGPAPVPQVKFQQRKASDNNLPLGEIRVPLACHTLSLLSHGHSLQAAPKPYLGSPGPKVLKCHPPSLITPHSWGESL